MLSLHDEQLNKIVSGCSERTSILPRYSSNEFLGIFSDTEAAGVSIAGHPQLIAL